MRVGSSRFHNQEPFIVTNGDTKRPWSGGENGKYFRCHLCGVRFVAGMVVRWILANGIYNIGRMGNPWVCQGCDGDDVIERLVIHSEGAKKYWWLRRGD
jgi:hypothetical protein